MSLTRRRRRMRPPRSRRRVSPTGGRRCVRGARRISGGLDYVGVGGRVGKRWGRRRAIFGARCTNCLRVDALDRTGQARHGPREPKMHRLVDPDLDEILVTLVRRVVAVRPDRAVALLELPGRAGPGWTTVVFAVVPGGCAEVVPALAVT